MISVSMTDKVKYVLGTMPETRISDQELYKSVMTLFYKDHVINEGDKFFVEVCDGLPQQQDISRVRRKVQELGMYSAPEEVRKDRQRLAKEAHGVLSDITESLKKDIARTK